MTAAPTPRFRSCSISSTRGSPRPRTEPTVSSREASSTTITRSTKSGIERMVSAISFSSSCAGTTTATRCPSSTPPRLRGAADDPDDRLPEKRREDSEQQPDQRRHDHGVAAALGGCLSRRRERLLTALFHLLGNSELLRCGRQLVGNLRALERGEQLFRRRERAAL